MNKRYFNATAVHLFKLLIIYLNGNAYYYKKPSIVKTGKLVIAPQLFVALLHRTFILLR